MSEIPKPYGEQHKLARQEALLRSKGLCEICKEKYHDLIAHHLNPRSLTFHNFTDNPDNYLILREKFHVLLHQVCNVNPHGIAKRQELAREIWKNPFDKKLQEEIHDIDKNLVKEYVSNTFDKLPHYMWEIVTKRMIESGFYMQRNLSIEIHQKNTHIKKLEATIKKLGNKFGFDGVNIINTLSKQYA